MEVLRVQAKEIKHPILKPVNIDFQKGLSPHGAAILALMPLAMGIGQGSAMQKPLATAIISGLSAQLPLVLIVLPVLLKSLGVRRT